MLTWWPTVNAAGWLDMRSYTTRKRTPTGGVLEAVNGFKKEIINGMLASLADEVRTHPEDLDVELEASGIRSLKEATQEVQICAHANHYIAQRTKSVNAPVPKHFWVRPAHLKGIAIYARETIYVLDVNADETARMQAYAYQSIRLTDGDFFDSGTVTPLATTKAMELLQDMRGVGILPRVMVLRWRDMGNHFQAIVYDAATHEEYVKKRKVMLSQRNEIIVKHGGAALDYNQFDAEKTAKAAAKKIRALRRAAKPNSGTAEQRAGEGSLSTSESLETEDQEQMRAHERVGHTAKADSEEINTCATSPNAAREELTASSNG